MTTTRQHLAARALTARRRLASAEGATGFQRVGVTLVELMIVLIVLAIVLAAAFPTVVRTLRANDVYEAASDVAHSIKKQRYRAQNYNRAAGVFISSTDNAVYGTMSISNRCSGLPAWGDGQWTKLTDVAAAHPHAKIKGADGTPGLNTVICIRADGRVLDAATGKPFTGALLSTAQDLGGALTFEVGHADDSGRSHIIYLPFNGVVRLEEGPAPTT